MLKKAFLPDYEFFGHKTVVPETGISAINDVPQRIERGGIWINSNEPYEGGIKRWKKRRSVS
jgi:hypothetical protein